MSNNQLIALFVTILLGAGTYFTADFFDGISEDQDELKKDLKEDLTAIREELAEMRAEAASNEASRRADQIIFAKFEERTTITIKQVLEDLKDAKRVTWEDAVARLREKLEGPSP